MNYWCHFGRCTWKYEWVQWSSRAIRGPKNILTRSSIGLLNSLTIENISLFSTGIFIRSKFNRIFAIQNSNFFRLHWRHWHHSIPRFKSFFVWLSSISFFLRFLPHNLWVIKNSVRLMISVIDPLAISWPTSQVFRNSLNPRLVVILVKSVFVLLAFAFLSEVIMLVLLMLWSVPFLSHHSPTTIQYRQNLCWIWYYFLQNV